MVVELPDGSLQIIFYFLTAVTIAIAVAVLWLVPHGKILIKRLTQRLKFWGVKKNYALARIYNLDGNAVYHIIDLNDSYFTLPKRNKLYTIIRGSVKKEFFGVSVIEYDIDSVEPITNTIYKTEKKILRYVIDTQTGKPVLKDNKPIFQESTEEVTINQKVIKYSPEQVDALVSRIIDTAMADALRMKQKNSGGWALWALIAVCGVGVVLFFQNSSQNTQIASVGQICTNTWDILNKTAAAGLHAI